jgi:hypothetical protein
MSADGEKSPAEAPGTVEQLAAEVETLRGQVDRLANALDSLSNVLAVAFFSAYRGNMAAAELFGADEFEAAYQRSDVGAAAFAFLEQCIGAVADRQGGAGEYARYIAMRARHELTHDAPPPQAGLTLIRGDKQSD